MQALRLTLALALLPMATASSLIAQESPVAADTASAQIRLVLRAFYLNYANQNWDALAAYVLSPKLLERRGAPGEAPEWSLGTEPGAEARRPRWPHPRAHRASPR